MDQYRAMVIDDHKIVSAGLRELLIKTGKFVSVDIFSSSSEALKELQLTEYQYVFTDLLMPGSNILEFIAFIRKQWEAMVIVVVSSSTDVVMLKQVFDAGADAYLSKFVSNNELEMALEKTGLGEKYISSDLAVLLAKSSFWLTGSGLTKREIDVLRCVAKGQSIDDAALFLHLSRHTVITHRRNIMEKLGLHSATEMVKYAYENNLI